MGGAKVLPLTTPIMTTPIMTTPLSMILWLLQALYYKKYSTASDVWSFGCVLYEIWSLGHKPFEQCTNDMVRLIGLVWSKASLPLRL